MSINPSRALGRLTKTKSDLEKARQTLEATKNYTALTNEVNGLLEAHKKGLAEYEVRKENAVSQESEIESCRQRIAAMEKQESSPERDRDLANAKTILEARIADLAILKGLAEEAFLALAKVKNDYTIKNDELQQIRRSPEWELVDTLGKKFSAQELAHQRRVLQYPYKLASHVRKARTHGFADQQNRTNATVKTAREAANEIMNDMTPQRALELLLAGV